MLQGILRVAKRVSKLLLQSFVIVSAVRAQDNAPNKILTCSEDASPAFAAQAQQVFMHALLHVCDESRPLLGNFEDSSPSMLKSFTLVKLTTGTYSAFDFEKGEEQHSNSYMTQKDENGNEQKFEFAATSDRRIFIATIEGKQGENCGALMNLECVIKEDEEPAQLYNALKSARM